MRRAPVCATAYSMLPNAWSSIRLPAVRITKRSPRFSSKTSSGPVRESAHATMMANGCCAWAVSFRRAAMGLPWDTSLVAKRRLPSLSLVSAASAGTEAAGGWSARTRAATLKQAMVAKRVSLDVVFIVGSNLFRAADEYQNRGDSATPNHRSGRKQAGPPVSDGLAVASYPSAAAYW